MHLDVAGGASASIIDAMRCAIDTSTHLTHMIKDSKPITYYEAFYMATMGGAIGKISKHNILVVFLIVS